MPLADIAELATKKEGIMKFKLPIDSPLGLHLLVGLLLNLRKVRKKRTPKSFEAMWNGWSDKEKQIFIQGIDRLVEALRPLMLARIEVEVVTEEARRES